MAACTTLILSLMLAGMLAAQFNNRKSNGIGDVLVDGYRNPELPIPTEGGPLLVDVQLYIRDLNVLPSKMEIQTTVTLRMNWTDHRLAYNDSHTEFYRIEHVDRVWMPDFFFTNERKSHFHTLMKPNNLIRIDPKGQVHFSARISLTLACPMNFRWFPFDRQMCPIKLASYGYTSDNLTLRWRLDNPVTFSLDLLIPQFRLDEIKTTNSTASTASGKYDGLIAELTLSRDSGSYVWRYFIPTTLAVMVSWVAFWLHPDAVTPRVLLALAALFGVYKLPSDQEPSAVSFQSAFDVWGLFMAVLAFLSLLETATISYLRQIDDVTKGQVTTHETLYEHTGPGTPLIRENNTTVSRFFPRRAEVRLDVISRFAFPLMFLLFSVIFWIVCLRH